MIPRVCMSFMLLVAFASTGALAQPCVPHWDPEGFPRWDAPAPGGAIGVLRDGDEATVYVGLGLASSPAYALVPHPSGGHEVLKVPSPYGGWTWAMTTWDDGTGEALYCAGHLTTGSSSPHHVLRFDGSEWSALGGAFTPTHEIRALAAFDDGSGERLYAGGYFLDVGGVPARRLAKWDGQAWTEVGGGVGASVSSPDHVRALRVWDNGSGPALFVGGLFEIETPTGTARNIAKWDGKQWHPLGEGTDDLVYALLPFDDGSGERLVAGGRFVQAGSRPAACVAAWDGKAWSALGEGFAGIGLSGTFVAALCEYDDGSGPRLFAGGYFNARPGSSSKEYASLAAWDGVSWHGEGLKVYNVTAVLPGVVRALQVGPTPGGDSLYIVGDFIWAGGDHDFQSAYRTARLDGQGMYRVGFGLSSMPFDIDVFEREGGSVLALAGPAGAGTLGDSMIYVWGSSGWEGIGKFRKHQGPYVVPSVTSLTASGYVQGESFLYALGPFDEVDGQPVPGIARLSGKAGATWEPVGTEPIPTFGTHRLLRFDFGDGEAVCLLGSGPKESVMGQCTTPAILRFVNDQWQKFASVGCNGPGANPAAWDAARFDEGAGERVFVCGDFYQVEGVDAPVIARWDGAAWSAVGDPLTGGVAHAMATFDDGSGEALYVTGTFTHAGSVPVNGIARWDGASWSDLNGGFAPYPGLGKGGGLALLEFDDGRGPALYAAGFFGHAGGVPALNVARWDGVAWEPLDKGLGGGFDGPTDMVAFDDGSGPAIFFSGPFSNASGIYSWGLAKWQGCAGSCYADCTGDGVLNVADFPCFQARFAAAEPGANCDASGTLDLFDFLCFVSAFNAGCP